MTWFINLKVRSKLLISFLLILAMALAVNVYMLTVLGSIDNVSEDISVSIGLARNVTIGMLAGMVVLGTAITLYVSRLTGKPLGLLIKIMDELTTTGNFDIDKGSEKTVAKLRLRKDEVGQISAAIATLIEMIQRKLFSLKNVSGGDLGARIVHRSDNDSFGNAMTAMAENLSNMMRDIQETTSHVSEGAHLMSEGAHSLAQGASEQTASVEQLSSSINEIAQKTKRNADTAIQASNLAKSIIDNAVTGNTQMTEMLSAVKEINEASTSISNIIKTIDDIAFQTNILALNAAVEAARAGQHGKGFAVVAEEVRSLAAKSANAAKETGDKIANSVEKAALGARIAEVTAASLTEIVNGINESSQLIGEIAALSSEQSEGIEHINNGIEQVAQVVQQNSDTAEKSAVTSKEMSDMAKHLEDLVAQFKLRSSDRDILKAPPSASGQPAFPELVRFGLPDKL